MGELASIGSAAAWAIASILFARLSGRFDPLVVNAGKCILGLACFGIVVLFRGTWVEILSLSASTVWILALSAVIGLALGDTAFFRSLALLGARRALLMTSLVPPLTALLGVVFLHEPLTLGLCLGMACTIGGVSWVISERTAERDDSGAGLSLSALRAGVFWGVLAQLAQAIGAIMTKLSADGVSALAVSVVRLSFGVLALIVLIVVTGRTRKMASLWTERDARARLLVATFLGTFVGIWLMTIGFLRAPVGVAATLQSLSPIFVLPMAALLLKERISPRAIAGAMVAIAGIALLFVVG